MRQDDYPSRVAREPALLERRDPVIHGSRPGPLDHGALAGYDRRGFLVQDGLFAPAEVEVLLAERNRLLADVQGDDDSLIREPGSRAVRSIFRIHQRSAVFSRLARDARLVAVAAQILGDDVYVHQSRLNYKPGFRGREFYWHSDFETWHVEDGMPRMRALSVSISLSDNTAVNGPLLLIPGSHRHYVACMGQAPEDHFRSSLRRQEYGVPDDGSLERLAEAGGIFAAEGRAGGAVFFDCNTMHGSNGNITPSPRSNVFIVYNAVSNRLEAPFGPHKARPDFLAERHEVPPLEPAEGVIEPGRQVA